MSSDPIIEEVKENSYAENKEEENILKCSNIEFNKINLLNNQEHSNSVNKIQQTKWDHLKNILKSKKNPISINNVNMPLHTKIVKKIFASVGTFIVSISSASILLNLFHIYSYQEQLLISSSKDFSLKAMMGYALFSLVITILGALSTGYNGEKMNKKFSSIWVPFSYAITLSFFIPDSHGVSVFSYLVKMIVSFIANF